ncbi:TetR/AcrR family transcriptional regulator (plasmid) [Deinococcus sp. KNUC1210]|uniref:TetR/AcrR family transcriptional regulator n=1 Tax=Deinococcus sp. KNUC1210 TaxID=2917691 RepID=UPI001EEFB4BD|nr:TetR/AcrR family transcriptional regulator [Deinococcus sp. KNUC1210]ULH17070.1 TetR/AcrR family transcriptional regulator [Deinococcus sp. KNUC1210]
MSTLPVSDAAEPQDSLRSRILDAAITLLSTQGRDALTTRTVAAAAGVQAPTLYRLFGDKRGLLDAVAAYGYTAFMRDKESISADLDPADQLRAGWDLQVRFGLAHPAVYGLMTSDIREGVPSSAESAGWALLHSKVRKLALVGRLKVSEDRAMFLFHSACRGLILTLLSRPDDQRDPQLSELAREGVLTVITTTERPAATLEIVNAAVYLRAHLPHRQDLTPGERLLMDELLGRLARHP